MGNKSILIEEINNYIQKVYKQMIGLECNAHPSVFTPQQLQEIKQVIDSKMLLYTDEQVKELVAPPESVQNPTIGYGCLDGRFRFDPSMAINTEGQYHESDNTSWFPQPLHIQIFVQKVSQLISVDFYDSFYPEITYTNENTTAKEKEVVSNIVNKQCPFQYINLSYALPDDIKLPTKFFIDDRLANRSLNIIHDIGDLSMEKYIDWMVLWREQSPSIHWMNFYVANTNNQLALDTFRKSRTQAIENGKIREIASVKWIKIERNKPIFRDPVPVDWDKLDLI